MQVVIVGAGVIGLWCALRLAKAGAHVTVLEAEPDDPGTYRPAASGAAAGMLAPFDAAGGAHEALALASFDLWREAAKEAPWRDDVRFDGGIIAASSAEDAAALQARVMQARRAVTPLSPGDARRRSGFKTGGFAHALFIADEGAADPVRTLSGLAFEARRFGALFEHGCDVAEISAHAARTHEGRVFEADAIVLAPGAWASAGLVKAAPSLRHIRAGKGHLVAVSLPRALKANLRTPGFYLCQRRDDCVLGSTLQFDKFERHVDADEVERLLAAAAAFAPGQVHPTGRAWAGIRPMSPDGWPLVGPVGDGLLIAAGHSRQGWLLAPITAEMITAYVLGQEIPPAWAGFAPQRFDTP